VLGTSGRSGLERLVLGSVAETVLRKATCPVVTVPARADGSADTGIFKRILCAIDFSHGSLRALDYAMALAQEVDARLTVLYVIESTPVVPSNARATVLANASTLREYQAAAREAGLARLEACIPDEVRSYCSVETRLATGNAGEEILHVAAESASDLIVIGIHGRSGADLWFFGSTANQVARGATCPVLTLRQP
jgi:nucleotide-binding universal stress UspA family protein